MMDMLIVSKAEERSVANNTLVLLSSLFLYNVSCICEIADTVEKFFHPPWWFFFNISFFSKKKFQIFQNVGSC